MAQLEFNEDTARALDELYRRRDAIRRRRHVLDAVSPEPGERMLDVGCGPGYYVAELADAVGDGHVTGVDSSLPMLAVAKGRCSELPNTDFHEADATELPFDDAEFDAVVSVQVLEYVNDVEAALAEIRRVLRPGGRVVLWDVDWGTLSMNARDTDRHERVLRAWDEHLADPALPRTLGPRLRATGFEDVRLEAHSFATAEGDPENYGVQLVGVITAFVSGRGLADEATAWATEQGELIGAGEFYSAVTQCCFTARRA